MLATWVSQARALTEEAGKLGVLVPGDHIDHIGIKCLSPEQFENLSQEMGVIAESLGTVDINGRPITTFRLEEPFQLAGQDIHILELAAPKSGESKEGFDHIEVVIQESFAERRARKSDATWTDVRWPSIINPELCLKLPSGGVKFHHRSLESVIEFEHEQPEILDIKVPRPEDYKTWVFDLDGTLISSFESIVDGVYLYTQEKALKLERSAVKAAALPTYPAYLEKLEGKEPTSKDLSLLAICEARCTGSVTPLPALMELLQQVRDAGMKTYLWTARFRLSVDIILEELGLTESFDGTFTSTEIAKPSQVALLSRLGPQAIMLGDSESDHRSAEINGMDFIKVPRL